MFYLALINFIKLVFIIFMENNQFHRIDHTRPYTAKPSVITFYELHT